MTSSLRTVIVDSDADSVAALKRILSASPSVVLVGEFVNARQAAHEAASLEWVPTLSLRDGIRAVPSAGGDARATMWDGRPRPSYR